MVWAEGGGDPAGTLLRALQQQQTSYLAVPSVVSASGIWCSRSTDTYRRCCVGPPRRQDLRRLDPVRDSCRGLGPMARRSGGLSKSPTPKVSPVSGSSRLRALSHRPVFVRLKRQSRLLKTNGLTRCIKAPRTHKSVCPVGKYVSFLRPKAAFPSKFRDEMDEGPGRNLEMDVGKRLSPPTHHGTVQDPNGHCSSHGYMVCLVGKTEPAPLPGKPSLTYPPLAQTPLLFPAES